MRHDSLPLALGAAALVALSACAPQKPGSEASPSPSPAASPGETTGRVLGGARETAERAGEAAERAGDAVAEGAKKAGEAIEEGAKKAKDAAEKVRGEAPGAAKRVGDVLEAKKQEVDVKAALMADPTVDASNIHVHADEKTREVHLTGSVPTAAQKTAAEKIARDKAEGYAVKSMLTVAAKR